MQLAKRIIFIEQGAGDGRRTKRVAVLRNLDQRQKCSVTNTKREDNYPFYLMSWSR